MEDNKIYKLMSFFYNFDIPEMLFISYIDMKEYTYCNEYCCMEEQENL
ncbi:MAG TPA: hypothetical protein GXX14_05215 [Clostridiaceae bacterium]|nr:hypothetical protein [Clostridiaceae bacterium]